MHYLSEDMLFKNRKLRNMSYCYDVQADEWFIATRRQVMKWAEENAIEDLVINPIIYARSGFSDEEPLTPCAALEIKYTMPKDWYVYPELNGKQIKELKAMRKETKAEVVGEIVRCKDCIHSFKRELGYGCDLDYRLGTNGKWFCADGERKGAEDAVHIRDESRIL